MSSFDPIWLPQFHTFPHHWTVSVAKHSPMTFTNVLEVWPSLGARPSEKLESLASGVEVYRAPRMQTHFQLVHDCIPIGTINHNSLV